jgi:hypothetical protein
MADSVITNVPARIWLQIGDDLEPHETDFSALTDVTWCQDNVNESDIEYVRADRHDDLVAANESQASQIARLEPELAAARAQLPPQHWNAVYNTDALQRACAELPEGWEIKIGLEKDAGWIDLYTPTGEQIDLVNAADTIYWMVHAAIDHARQTEAHGEKND